MVIFLYLVTSKYHHRPTIKGQPITTNFYKHTSVLTDLYLAKVVPCNVTLCYTKKKKAVAAMARPKKYIIKLSDDERATLQKTIRNKKTCKTVLKRCQILLELDEEHGTGLTHAQIAHSYAVCPATITNIIQSYVKNGITNIVRYNINPNSSAALRKVDGRTEARIIQMACGPVPEGHSRWTLRLLEEKVRVELDVPVGRETIRETLKKMNFDLTKTPTGAFHLKKMQNS